MTRCDELNRWLDEGRPAEGAPAARAHAATCPRCGAAVAEFDAIERALARPAPALPDGAAFSARVMEQVAAAPPLAIVEPKRVPWWLAVLAEPGFSVAAAAAVVLIATPAAIRLDATQSVGLPASIAVQSVGVKLGAALAGWFDPSAAAEHLSPVSRLSILVGFTPLLVWAGLWMFGAVERLLRNRPARRG